MSTEIEMSMGMGMGMGMEMDEEEVLKLKLTKSDGETEYFTERPSIEINDDETCLFYLEKIKSVKELKQKNINLLNRLIAVLRKKEGENIKKDDFNLSDTLNFVHLMREHPDYLEEIQACSDYLVSIVEYKTTYTEETLYATMEAMDALMNMMKKKND